MGVKSAPPVYALCLVNYDKELNLLQKPVGPTHSRNPTPFMPPEVSSQPSSLSYHDSDDISNTSSNQMQQSLKCIT